MQLSKPGGFHFGGFHYPPVVVPRPHPSLPLLLVGDVLHQTWIVFISKNIRLDLVYGWSIWRLNLEGGGSFTILQPQASSEINCSTYIYNVHQCSLHVTIPKSVEGYLKLGPVHLKMMVTWLVQNHMMERGWVWGRGGGYLHPSMELVWNCLFLKFICSSEVL